MAGDHVPGGHPDACLQFQARQFAAEFAGGLEGVGGGVVDGDGRTEHGQRGVALELVDHALVAVHHLNDDLEEVVQRGHDLLRGVVDGEGGGADHVDEYDGHAAVLPAELRLLLERLLGDLGADVAAEDVSDALALVEAAHHLVEPGL